MRCTYSKSSWWIYLYRLLRDTNHSEKTVTYSILVTMELSISISSELLQCVVSKSKFRSTYLVIVGQFWAQWKNTGGVTRRTLQTFRMAVNWHFDLQLASFPYFLLFQQPLKPRYFRPRIPLWANIRLSWAIKWRFWDTISLFLRWIFLWTYVLRSMDVRPKVYARTS